MHVYKADILDVNCYSVFLAKTYFESKTQMSISLGQVLLQVRRFSPVKIITPVLHVLSFILTPTLYSLSYW
jgi:hypothetical protein